MKVKVCGMREPENLDALSQLPIDYIGFIFYKNSPRFIKGEQLMNWISENEKKLAGKSRVGVFVDSAIEDILNKVHDYQLDFVQLHGHESPEYCREVISYWEISTMRRAKLAKAFSIDEGFDFQDTQAYEPHCSFFIFDTKSPSYGGSGKKFDWNLLENYMGMTPYLLSGGIDVKSAKQIRQLNFKQMMGVDINSRFEKTAGLKDIDMIKSFLQELNS